ncbi:hypothetical protein D9758_005583 [Tetrapyrgos nigripes]|uniref:Arylamine N-acetyltransferase n=1 Tax=Tetrapyrgos nigripes TaxID=182062 RepID=A0A8H5GGH9_9AGAR|nr:hypothetical protein D9758_005583 [Tetrapyrgos nigripes]
MHYTSSRTMDITPEGLFQRLVVEGNGHYCFGLNTLFMEMIRGLGYREDKRATDTKLASHLVPLHRMVVFVQPKDGNETYLTDACGGGSCITNPILLANGQTVMGTSPTETHTLVRSAHPKSSLESSPRGPNASVEWHLIIRHKKPSGDLSERVCYSFLEDEFFQTDFDSANVSVYSEERGYFVNNLICSKCFWLSADEMEMLAESGPKRNGGNASKKITNASVPLTHRYMGRLGMEGNTVRRHVGPRSEIIRIMKMEMDRIEALRDIFGVDIPPQDICFMKDRVPALDR